MSDDRGRRPKKGDYEVGYGKPPKDTRFQPGVCPNPSGRPPGSKNKCERPALREDQLNKLIFQEANRKIKVREDGRTRTITMAEAILRSLAAKAAQRSRLHQKLFFELYSQSEASERERDQEILRTVIEYKSKMERVLKRCKAAGEEPPDLFIHPDDIHIDGETGEITLTAPTAWDRKAEERKWRAIQAGHRQEIAEFERELEKTEDPETRKSIERDIEYNKENLSLLIEVLGDKEPEPSTQK